MNCWEKSDELLGSYTITEDQVALIQEETKSQANSTTLWFNQHAGRVTASNYKTAAKTYSPSPSLSLTLVSLLPSILQILNFRHKMCKMLGY